MHRMSGHLARHIRTELELDDVERRISGADPIERANHAARHEAPEAFDGFGMDRANDVLGLAWPTQPCGNVM
jgi:hypothetical protein